MPQETASNIDFLIVKSVRYLFRSREEPNQEQVTRAMIKGDDVPSSIVIGTPEYLQENCHSHPAAERNFKDARPYCLHAHECKAVCSSWCS